MQKKIEELAAGKCSGTSSILQFSVEQLEFEVVEGKNYTGEFIMESTDEIPLQGIIYSSSPRMECHDPKFQGKKITQTFEFHSEGLIEGDSQKGNFHIICNQGEYDLPFSMSVSRNYVDSSIGKIKSVFEFANLARKSYEEAVKVFSKPEFINVFKPQETEERLVYRGLKRKPCTMAQVEEFLIATKKKKRITFQIEEAEREFSGIRETQKQHITLKKDQWGYTAIRMTSDADWLWPVKKVITTEEFVGNRALAEYIIDAQKLHAGKNFGRITCKTPFQTEQVEICVVSKSIDREGAGPAVRKKKVELTKAYIDFRLHRTVTGVWAKQTCQKLDELHLLEPDNLWYLLAKAQVFLANKQRQEAEWALDSFPKHKVNKESTLYAYYMYLCTLREPEPSYVNKLTGRIRRIYHKNQENDLLLWMLLFLDEELNYSKGRKLEVIARQIARGRESVVLYLEAYQILAKEPYLMYRAGSFERKILNWAAKQKVLTRGIAEQLCQLVPEIPAFHPVWYQILSACYEVYPEKEMLQAICSYCMKWNCYGARYWKWYHLGVGEELRIAGIYEAWMLSAHRKQMEKIPKVIVMYFQYHSNLAYRPQAMLYDAMIENKASWKSSYLHYRKNMEEFALKQLRAGRIDKYLAPIYREVLKPDMITEELAGCFAKVLFAHEVTCSNPNALRLVVCQQPLAKEQVVPLNHGTGYVNIYSSTYQILLEDAKGNRFLPEESLSVVPLLESEKFLDGGIACAKEKIPYLLKYFDRKKIWQTYEKEDLSYLQMIVESDSISEEYREELRPQMIAYYYYNYTGDALDQFLLSLSFDGMQKRAREKIMELLVARHHYKKAYELLLSYGCEHISAPKLVYVIRHRMDELEEDQGLGMDEFLLELCRIVFLRGKYNERILTYMCQYFYGNLEEMIKLWQAACNFELDTYELEERCLIQFLYTGDFSVSMEKIFESYGEKQGKEEVILAYLSQMSHQFVTRDAVVAEYVFQKIFRLLKEQEELNEICRLGFLKWCASRKDLAEEEIRWAEKILEEQISRGIYFPFYHTLPEKFAGTYLYHDRVFQEYRTSPDTRVVISFLSVDSEDYEECEMQQMYDGIYVKEFLVFYGEKIPYYIKEEQNGEWIVTESGQIQNNEICTSAEGSRYDLLNDMMVSYEMKDEATLRERLETYCKMDKQVKEKFRIL